MASPKWYLILHQPKLLVARTSTSSPALYDNSSSLFALYDSRATQYPDKRKKKNYTGLLNFRWAVKRERLDTTVTWKFVLWPFCSFPMSFICGSPNALYLSVNVFSTFYVFIRATRRSSRLQGNAFETLSISPVPEIEYATSRCAVKQKNHLRIYSWIILCKNAMHKKGSLSEKKKKIKTCYRHLRALYCLRSSSSTSLHSSSSKRWWVSIGSRKVAGAKPWSPLEFATSHHPKSEGDQRLKLSPHISGYFLIKNFFFPDSAYVRTYPVNPVCESATFWICAPEWTFLNTLWIRNQIDAKSGFFFIRWRNKIEPNSLPWILYSRWQPPSQVLSKKSKM